MTRGGLSGPVTVVAVTCEFWMHGFPVPGQTQRLAVRAEELGFDGLLLAALARDVLPVVRRGTES